MKMFVVFLLITAFTSMLSAQNNCKSPLLNQQFLQKYNQVENMDHETVFHLLKTNEYCTMLKIIGIELFKYKNSILSKNSLIMKYNKSNNID